MIKDSILKIAKGSHLTEEEMVEAMNAIMAGEVPDAQIGAFLTALKMKGESVSEIFGGAKVMREKATGIDLSQYYTIDTCGTGGSVAETYNVSTAVSIVSAAAGVKVVKHGNRAVSSKCGAADVLEALGVNIELSPDQIKACVEEVGIGFLYARTFHSAMRHVASARVALGYRTVFNILGPLSNPAAANGQVLGVFDESLTEPMAEVLLKLGVEKALVVHGLNGLDEISISADTKVTEIKDGVLSTYIINPEDLGFMKQDDSELTGGYADENAVIIRNVLSGKHGARRDILLLNAGAALYVGQKADSIKAGIELASQIIDSGQALAKLDEFIQFTQKF